jgi:hypothetical protein
VVTSDVLYRVDAIVAIKYRTHSQQLLGYFGQNGSSVILSHINIFIFIFFYIAPCK